MSAIVFSKKRLLGILVGATAFLFFWSDLFNYFAAGTIAAAWKQLIVVIFWVVALFMRAEKWCRELLLFSLAAQILLIAGSLIQGVELEPAIFNSMLYASWVPMFVVLSRDSVVEFLRRTSNAWIWLIAVSAVGLLVDLYSDFFSFLPRNDLENAYYDRHGLAKRASFFFPAKTMVVPLIGAAGLLTLAKGVSTLRLAVLIGATLAAIVATGSMSSLITGAILMATLAVSIRNPRVQFMGVLILIVAVVGVVTLGATDRRVARQVDKVVENLDARSDANTGRKDLWVDAKNAITDQDVFSWVVGYGLGVTNDAHGNRALHTHGESSILQAQLEGGVIAVLLRLIPFLLLAVFIHRARTPLKGPLFGWATGSFLAILVAPTFGNMPFMFFLSLMMAMAWRVAPRGQIPN